MRDTDRDLTSLVVVRSEGGHLKPAELRGKRVAVGAKDSPQATLIPLAYLVGEGSAGPRWTSRLCPSTSWLGKHGDHIGGEREAARALVRGEADAACMIDGNHLAFIREGTLTSSGTRILARTAAVRPLQFHGPGQCAGRELLRAVLRAAARHELRRAEVRPLLDLEGLKQWLPGRTEGYKPLAARGGQVRYHRCRSSRAVAAQCGR